MGVLARVIVNSTFDRFTQTNDQGVFGIINLQSALVIDRPKLQRRSFLLDYSVINVARQLLNKRIQHRRYPFLVFGCSNDIFSGTDQKNWSNRVVMATYTGIAATRVNVN